MKILQGKEKRGRNKKNLKLFISQLSYEILMTKNLHITVMLLNDCTVSCSPPQEVTILSKYTRKQVLS
jgi:hypothetical protein